MADEQNAGTESPAGETSATDRAEESTQSTQSAQNTPTAPDPAELLAQLGADELRNIPAIKKLLDDQAAGLKAAERRRLERKQAKQEPQPAQPGHDAFDIGELVSAITERVSAQVTEQFEPLRQGLEELRSSRQADQFDADYAKSGLPEGLKQDLRDLSQFRKVKPSDLPKFFAEQRKKHLPGEGDKTPAIQPAKPQPQQGKPTPGATMNGGGVDLDGVINPLTMSAEDVARARADGRLVEIAERWRNRNLPSGNRRRFPGRGTR